MPNISPPLTQRVFKGLEEIAEAVGTTVGVTPWFELTQQDVNTFADVTRDHQWIHLDEQRAAQSLFGSTIAHGYFVLSLIAHFTEVVYRVEGVSMQLNYGSNSVRFPSPAKVGGRIRGEIEFLSLEEKSAGHLLVAKVVVAQEGEDKPVCVAEVVTLLVA